MIIALGVSDAVLPECAQWLEDDQHGHSDVGCQEQTKGSKDQSLVHGRIPLFSSHLALPGFNMPRNGFDCGSDRPRGFLHLRAFGLSPSNRSLRHFSSRSLG